MFIVKESNLICIYAGESRKEVIKDIKRALPYLDNPDMIELLERVIERLLNMTNEEILIYKFIVEYV